MRKKKNTTLGSLFLSLVIALAANPASAGAWAREVGSSFLSLSSRFHEDQDAYPRLYMELGGAERLSFALEIAEDEEGATALAALTYHFAAREAQLQYAAGMAYGVLSDEVAGQLHLNLGYGWSAFGQNGWASLDASQALTESAEIIRKIDFTLGRSGSGGRLTFAQLFLNWDEEGEPIHSAELHQVFGLTNTLKLDLGLSQRFSGSTGIVIGIWAEF